MKETKEALKVRKLSFSYKESEQKILNNISFSVKRGEALGIIGPSGCGKSTLCFCLSGIIPHNQDGKMDGDVFLFGKNTKNLSLPQIATKVGIVFQDPETQLFLPEIQNELAFGPENLCIPQKEIKQIIEDICNLTKIKHLLFRNPNEISGGQRQIAALASVLCLNPEIIILDEATSQLDKESSKRIKDIVKLLKKKNKTIIMVEHDLERLKIADKILVLKDGQIMTMECADEVLGNNEILRQCYLFNSAVAG